VKVAVITPYHNETEAILRRCMDSIVAQTVPVTHFMISDGVPQEALDSAPVRHVKLGAAHADWGDTPRAVGSVLAMREGFDALTYLDADNYYLADHIELMIEAQAKSAADIVVASRFFLRPDGSVLPYEEDPPEKHVDTSCMFITRPAFGVTPLWALMPRPFSVMGDRLVWAAIKSRGHRWVRVEEKTVAYFTLWASMYRACGEDPPPGAKEFTEMSAQALEWWRALPQAERTIHEKVLGMKVNFGN